MNRRKHSRGFTLVELLMVVALTTTGFVGLFNLQAASIKGMGNMIRMTQATTLAENFISRLRLEFSAWTTTQPLSSGGLFPHLAGLPTDDGAQPGVQTPGDGIKDGPGWVIGDVDGGTDRRVSIAGDAHPLGYNTGTRQAMLVPDMEDEDQHFCLLYRLTWMRANRAIRV
jgi:prepilin-type N-terminal cleavage/methylation domain-containing protein